MSGRKSKRTQKFGSSRRNRHNRDTEGRDDDGFPQSENEEHKNEQNDFCPVSENQPAVARQPEAVCIDQPTSTSDLLPHSQSPDLVAPVELASRRKMGSSRKSRGLKFKGVYEEDPEQEQETSKGISGEVIEEMTIKEVENKDDFNQPGHMYHESSSQQEEDLAFCNITAAKDVPGNDEHPHLELALESQTMSTCSYELDQSKEMALEQELMRQTHDSSLLTPTHLLPCEVDDSLETYNQTETFCERVITYTDQENKTDPSQGLLSAKKEEKQDVHTILNTKHVQPSLNFMGEDKQENFREQDDATVVLSVNEQEQQDLNDRERGLCSIKDETKATQKVTETVTMQKCSTDDYEHIDNSLKLKDNTEEQTEEMGHIYENTEFSESTDKNMEVYVVGNKTDSELHEEVVAATHLKHTEVPYTNIILSPKLANQAEQPSIEKHLHELEPHCEPADSELIHQREDEYDSEFRHFIAASSAEEDNAKQEDYLKEPDNEETCRETKKAEQETENNVMESNNSYQFVMYPSVTSEINPAESLCEEMHTNSFLHNDLGDFPAELEMHTKNLVSADLPPHSCQLPEDKLSQGPTFSNVGPLQLNDSTVNQEQEKEKYTHDNRSGGILEKIKSPENLYDNIVFSREEQEASGGKIVMSDETVELKVQDRLTPSKEHERLLVSDSLNDTNTEKVQQEEGNAIRSADQLFSAEGLEINAIRIEEDVKQESYRNQKSEETDVLQARGDKIDGDDDNTEITHENNISQIYSTAAEDSASQTLEKEVSCSEVSAAMVTPLTPPLTDVHSISYKHHVTKSSYNLPIDSLTEEESKSTNNLPENNETSTTLFVCEESEMAEILTTTQNHGELDRETDDTVVIGNICTGVDATLAVQSDIAEHQDTEVHKVQSKTELTERIIQIEASIVEGQEDSGSMLLEDSLLNFPGLERTQFNASEGAESDTVITTSDPIMTSVEKIKEGNLPESIKHDAIIPFEEEANVLISISSHSQKIENVVNEDMYEIYSSNILSTDNMLPEKNHDLQEETNAGPIENITMEDVIMVCSEHHVHSELSSQTTEQGLPTNRVQLPETECSGYKKDENMSGENVEMKEEEHERNKTKKKRFGSKRRIQGRHQGNTEGQEREWKEVEGSEGVSLEIIDPASTLSLLTKPQNAVTDVSSSVQVATLTPKQKEMVEPKEETGECGRIETPPVLPNVVFGTDTVTFDKLNNADELGEPTDQHGKPDVHDTGDGEFTYINEKDMIPVIEDASTDHVSMSEHSMESTENESTSQIQGNSASIPEELGPKTQNNLIMPGYKENIVAVVSDQDQSITEDHLKEPEQLASAQPVVQMQHSNSAQDNVLKDNSGFSFSRQKRKMGSTRKSLRGKIMEDDQTDTLEAMKEKENIQEKAPEIRPPVSEEDRLVAEALSVVSESNQSIERHSETSGSLRFMSSKADMGLRNGNNTEDLQQNNVTSPALFMCEENETELTSTQNSGERDREKDGTVVIRNICEGIDVTPTTPSDVAEHLDTEVHKGQSNIKSIESIIQNEESETKHSGSKEDHGTNSENVVKHDVKLHAQIQTKKKKFGSTRKVQGRHQRHTEGKEREWEDKEGEEQEIKDPTSTSNLLTKLPGAVTDVSSGIQVPTLTMEQKEITESKNESKECEIIHIPPVLSNVFHETDTAAFEVNDGEGLADPGQYTKPGVDDKGNGEFTYVNEQQMLPVITEDQASTDAKQHGMESTENENTSQIYSTCVPVKLSPEAQDTSILEVCRENVDVVLSDKDHIVSEDHQQELLNRELEPEQFKSTVAVVQTQKSKSAQDNVTSMSRPRRKMGSTRKSVRFKISEDDQTETSVIKESENIKEQATEYNTAMSEKNYSEAETPSIIPETSHQSIERPETAEEFDRKDIKSARTEIGVSTVSMFHDTPITLGSAELQNQEKLVEGSLLSEIASDLKKSYQSPLITTEPNASHLIPDSASNSPLEACAHQPDIPEISESMCEQKKDTHQVSPSPRRRKMGSTRKIGRNMPTEKRNNDNEETEKGTEDMAMNKNDQNSQNERETEAFIKVKLTEEIKGSVQPSSEVQAASQVLESSTSEEGHPLPGGKRKFGSRRTAKDRGGVGALAPGNYDTIQRKTDSSAPNNDLLVCDPHFTSGPGSTSASQHGGIESSPRTEEVIKPTVKATDAATGTGLVSLGDIRKSSPSVGSTRERQKLDLEQLNEPIPDFGQAVYNVVMVGNSNVGKTSFIRRLQNGHFNTDYSATIGVDTFVQTVTLGNKTVKLYVWDTAGQERYHSITRQVFHKAQGLLLMYDITSSHSFHAVRDWIYQVQEKAPDDVIVMLLGNKSDCVKREVQLQEGEELSKEFDIHFMECSVATGENVSECMKTLAWLLVKQRVRKEEEHTVLQPDLKQKKSGCC